MATESNKMSLGSECPSFSLRSVDERAYTLDDFSESKGLLVAFICNHCPYVKAIEGRLIALSKTYSKNDVQVVAICSNDSTNYPEDAPLELLRRWREKDYGFPYLVDDSQIVAKSFDAACTPDLFLYDAERKLYYHGRLDDNWKEPSQVKIHDMKIAIDALLKGEPAPAIQIPALGCSIKWKRDFSE